MSEELWTITIRDRWGVLIEEQYGLTWDDAEAVSEKYTYTEEFPYQIEFNRQDEART